MVRRYTWKSTPLLNSTHFPELERNAAPDIVIAIAASKKDLESERKVEATTGAQYAAR